MEKCSEHKTDGFGWVYESVIQEWRQERTRNYSKLLETTRNYSKRENGDPNGFNDETVQALKDATEQKNLSKVYETLDDMYADMETDCVPVIRCTTPTIYGYPIEHLEMIARVMAKENCTPEDVVRVLQDAGAVAKMVRDEILETIERSCIGESNETD